MSAAFVVSAVGDIPEQGSLFFQTSGSQGGDAGHGACATLSFVAEGGSHSVAVYRRRWARIGAPAEEALFELDGNFEVVIAAQGDWEIGGLASALGSVGSSVQKSLDEEQAATHERLQADYYYALQDAHHELQAAHARQRALLEQALTPIA